MVKLYLQILLFIVLENSVFPCSVNKKNIIEDTIISTIESRIKCNCEFRYDAPLNIVISNSEIVDELRGIINGIITFDTIIFDSISPLIIKDFQPQWLRLIDVKTNEIIFNQSMDLSMRNIEDYKIFLFYSNKLLPIIMNMKCWVEYYNYFFPPIYSRISFSFPFRVIPDK